MSPRALRISIGLALLGLAGSAVFGALAMSGEAWAVPLLWRAGILLLLAGVVTLFWPLVARRIVWLGKALEARGYGIYEVRSGAIQLHSLLSPDRVLRNLDVRDAVIVGPAVILFPEAEDGLIASIRFPDCTFDDNEEYPPTIWVWPDEEDPLAGAMRAENCRFYRCRFYDVAWAAPYEAAKALTEYLEERMGATEEPQSDEREQKSEPTD